MSSDTNTIGYSQWFYFSLRNMKKNIVYNIKIVNFKKSSSFFNKGMIPLIFSLKKYSQNNQCGWYRDGFNIKYYKSEFQQANLPSFYTLQFQIKFQNDNDFVKICPYPPYSYTKLNNFLTQTIEKNNNKTYLQLQSISKTLGGNKVPYLIISKNRQNLKQKTNIVIIGRQHSGQTWSSFLIQQLIKQILSKNDVSQRLLNQFNFHIFPMVNVDGVIYGNFRCDLAGYDLNRSWKYPKQKIHNQIFSIKNKLKQLSNKIQMFLDIHTHTKQFGIFSFNCLENDKCKKIPYRLSKDNPLFRIQSCTFGITKDKKSTARAIVYDMIKKQNIITIELSSFGIQCKNNVNIAFSPIHMQQTAKRMIHSLRYLLLYQQTNYCSNNKFLDQLQIKQNDINGNKSSDSQPEIDRIPDQIKINKIFSQKFCNQLKQNQKNKLKKKNKRQIFVQNKNYFSIKNNKSKNIQDQIKENTKQFKKTQQSINVSKRSSIIQNSLIYKRTTYPQARKSKKQKQKQQQVICNQSVLLKKQSKPINFIQFSMRKLPIFGQTNQICHSQLINRTAKTTIHRKKQFKLKTQLQYQNLRQRKTYQHKIKKKKQTQIQNTLNSSKNYQYLCVSPSLKQSPRTNNITLKTQYKQYSNIKKKEMNVLSLTINKQKTVHLKKQPNQIISKNAQLLSRIWMNNYQRYSNSLKKC